MQRKMVRKDILFGCGLLFLLLAGGCRSVQQQQDEARLQQLRLLDTQARTAEQAGRWAQALQRYDELVRTTGFAPGSEAALAGAARAAAALDRLDLFLERRNRLAEWFPDSPLRVALEDLHWQLLLRRHRPAAAAAVLKPLLDGNRFSGIAEDLRWYRLGECYREAFQPVAAAEAWLQVVRGGRSSEWQARSLFRLAERSFKQGNRELALYYVNRMLRDYPAMQELQRDGEILRRAVRWRMITKKQGLADDSISAITFDGDTVWIGTWLGGITRFERSTGKQTLFRAAGTALASDLIRDIAVDGNTVWAATFEGLSRYDKRVDRWSTVYAVAGLAYQRIKKVVPDGGRLWVATIACGLSVFDRTEGKWTTYSVRNGLPGNNVVALCVTPASVWVGTVSGGLGRLDKKSGRWTVYRKQLPTRNVKALAFDGRRIWIGTHGAGALSCLEDGTDWKRYTKENSGLTSNFVFSVTVAPSGRIWMGTLEGGAAVFDESRNKWEQFTVADGLPSNDITTVAFEGRFVWFGTLNGGVAVLLRDRQP